MIHPLTTFVLFYLEVSLAIALSLSGFTLICHYTLRLLLAATGRAPLRIVRVLDHAVERVFLRRVGGGYIFVHRLLAEYFAKHAQTRLAERLPEERGDERARGRGS